MTEINIFEIIKGNEPRPISVFMTKKIITIGGGSKGVTIKNNLVKEFELITGDILGINIKVPK